MSRTVLVLGGGWGGLTATHSLKNSLPSVGAYSHEKSQSFVFYPSYLKAITGELTGLKCIESPLKDLLRKDLEIINEDIIRVNPEAKTVYTNAQTIQADYIIIALGAELYPSTIPGFNEYALTVNINH
ncbi:MAG TPA: FAD-dependent oxidoreductase [Bacteroidia bacterium]